MRCLNQSRDLIWSNCTASSASWDFINFSKSSCCWSVSLKNLPTCVDVDISEQHLGSVDSALSGRQIAHESVTARIGKRSWFFSVGNLVSIISSFWSARKNSVAIQRNISPKSCNRQWGEIRRCDKLMCARIKLGWFCVYSDCYKTRSIKAGCVR